MTEQVYANKIMFEAIEAADDGQRGVEVKNALAEQLNSILWTQRKALVGAAKVQADFFSPGPPVSSSTGIDVVNFCRANDKVEVLEIDAVKPKSSNSTELGKIVNVYHAEKQGCDSGVPVRTAI